MRSRARCSSAKTGQCRPIGARESTRACTCVLASISANKSAQNSCPSCPSTCTRQPPPALQRSICVGTGRRARSIRPIRSSQCWRAAAQRAPHVAAPKRRRCRLHVCPHKAQPCWAPHAPRQAAGYANEAALLVAVVEDQQQPIVLDARTQALPRRSVELGRPLPRLRLLLRRCGCERVEQRRHEVRHLPRTPEPPACVCARVRGESRT